jgi:hypothetical protein
MPKTGRRNLLKMLGMTPALLVPWKPATEQIVQPPAPVAPPIPAISPDPSGLNGPPEMREWSRAMLAAGAYSATGSVGYWGPFEGADDGTV